MKQARAVVALGLLAAAAPAFVVAQTAPPAATPPVYRPGLGDLMTATVQPRHIKLALAGREKNWDYAGYELHELDEALDRVARVWPKWRGKPIADMVKSVAGEPIAALAEAIKARDADKYQAAYNQLTEACNTCHLGAERGIIVIRAPDGAVYPDQDFRAAGK